MKKFRKKHIIKILLTPILVVAIFVLFLSHRMTYKDVQQMLEYVDIQALHEEALHLHSNGVVDLEGYAPLPYNLKALHAKKIRFEEGGLFVVLDSFWMAETGLIFNALKDCADTMSPYCEKLDEGVFYFHFPN